MNTVPQRHVAAVTVTVQRQTKEIAFKRKEETTSRETTSSKKWDKKFLCQEEPEEEVHRRLQRWRWRRWWRQRL